MRLRLPLPSRLSIDQVFEILGGFLRFCLFYRLGHFPRFLKMRKVAKARDSSRIFWILEPTP